MAAKRNSGPRRPGIGATVAKIVVGLIFLGISGSDPGGSDPAAFITMCLSIGLGLIAWGVLPWLRYRKDEKLRRTEAEQKRAEMARRKAEKKAAEENRVRICPHCGAPGRGLTCEYCGSPLP